MAEELEIRDAGGADRGGLRHLYAAAFTATYGPTLGTPVVDEMLSALDASELRDMLPGRDERAAVAMLHGQVVGSVVAAERGVVAYLWGMYVHPAHQRRGIGTGLLRHAAGWLSRAAFVEVRVLPSSPWAVAFYARHGFRETGQEPFQVVGGVQVQALVMRVPCAALMEQP